jgi:hypothetical protein
MVSSFCNRVIQMLTAAHGDFAAVHGVVHLGFDRLLAGRGDDPAAFGCGPP